jgi:hypothetical protein
MTEAKVDNVLTNEEHEQLSAIVQQI